MAGAALLEREAELATISAAVEALSGAEAGSLLVVEGSAGIGKSELLARARGLAIGDGATVLSARGGEFERDYPFGVVRQLLERPLAELSGPKRKRVLSGAAAHAAPALGLVPTPEAGRNSADAQFATVHAVYWLLANLAEENSLLVSIDDLHWCDEQSLRVISYVCGRLAEHPMLLAVALRPSDASQSQLVGAIAGDSAAIQVRPRPLGASATGELLRSAFGGEVAEELVLACADASAGNPFFLRELVAGLVSEGFQPNAASATVVAGMAPATVSRSTLLRIGRLPPLSAELAAALAVLGEEAEPRHMAALVGVEMTEATGALDALVAEGVIESDPLRFSHPVVRQAVHEELAPARRAELHEAVAAMLMEEGSQPADVAHHLLNSPRAGSEDRVRWLREAGARLLERGAPDAAGDCLRRAIAEPAPTGELASLRFELGRADWFAGSEIEPTVTELQAGVDGARDEIERAERAVVLARAITSGVDVPRAFEVLERELDSNQADPHSEAIARLRAEHTAVGVLHPETTERAVGRLDSWPLAEGEAIGDLLELGVRAMVSSLNGSSAEAARLAETALAGDRILRSEGPDSVVFYVAVFVLIVADRHGAAREHLEAAKELSHERSSSFGFASACGLEAVLDWRRGENPKALAIARTALDAGVAHPFPLALLLTCSALARSDGGDPEGADAELAPLGIGPDLPPLLQVNTAFYARAVIRISLGRSEDALADLDELESREVELGVANSSVSWRALAIPALLARGEQDRALAMAEAEHEFARRWGTSTAIGQAHRCRGLALGDQGIDELRMASEALEDSPTRREHLLATLDLGRALRRSGARSDAREVLTRAMDLASRSGALAFATIAHDELRVAGARPRRLQFSGLESLTPGELRVSEMAADGLTNKEIAESLYLSTRTVENHLARVYRKLDISSRSELPEALARQ